MSEDVHHAIGVIGPNAILQLLPVLDRLGGPERRAQILAEAGIFHLPDGKAMIPETDAARLHHRLREVEPDLAPALAAHAGLQTANYILKNRIPNPVQWLLKALPKGLAARFLSQAIAKHAWTFVGSGRFTVLDPWTFEIHDNPLIKGETSDQCLCHWHAGVFAQLYETLVSDTCVCAETTCGAQSPGTACHFELSASA
ncbi:MAG: bacteriochlorophyll 4-vinyl reductase [Boseongicola sp.]|nr:bacteriochlorophyll 4-vinyl reductase [Boseongicola sp.]